MGSLSSCYKEQYRYHTTGHPVLQSASSPSKQNRDAARERARNGVLPGGWEAAEGTVLQLSCFSDLVPFFLQKACAILALKPLKQGITLEMPNQDDI